MTVSQADLPATVSREQIIRDSDAVLGMPDIPVSVEEDIVRIARPWAWIGTSA